MLSCPPKMGCKFLCPLSGSVPPHQKENEKVSILLYTFEDLISVQEHALGFIGCLFEPYIELD